MITRAEDRRRRTEARAAGKAWYWGFGCRRCGKYQVRRYASTGHCVACQRKNKRIWRDRNREKATAILRKHLRKLAGEGRLEGPLV